jgi:DNA-binding transcriptional LysR family regulator
MPSRTFDYNLLTPLRVLLEERSVSKAAERMHMSQPALSAALSRLRVHFGDQLLERRGNNYELTPLAMQLLDRSYSAARSMERVFSAQAEFDPETSTREFSIFSSDYAMAVVGPFVSDLIAERAPSARLQFFHFDQDIVAGAPDTLRDFDGVIIPHGFISGASHLDLLVDSWVCVIAADNPEVGDELTLDDLRRLPWVFTYNGMTQYSPGFKQMQQLGIDPHIDVVTPSFLAAPFLVAGTRRITLAHGRLGAQFAIDPRFRVLACPFEVLPLRESFWWNSVHDRDPEHIWLRSVLTEAATRLEPGETSAV